MNNIFKCLILNFLICLLQNVQACTNYLVTKGASSDSCTMISYAADSHIRYGELYFKPAHVWPNNMLITLYDRGTNKPLGEVLQARQTYQVVGFMNEFQVSIGETTFGGRKELTDTTGIVDYGSLMFLALQRSKSAREAIKVMAELVNEYGYASSGESFSIGDPNEVWIMELIGKGTDLNTEGGKNENKNKGAVWVAIRIPDGYVSAHANHARICQFPLDDGMKSISSQRLDSIFNPAVEVVYAYDVISFARNKGYFTGDDKDFSFSEAYAPMDFEAARFCELRVWAFFNAVSDSMDKYWDCATGKDLKTRLPLYVKPNRKLTPLDLMACKRNYLQGTPLDMSKDAGAGPFGLPYRWRPLTWKYDSNEYFNERVTVTQQTGFSFIAQMRSYLPDPIGGVFWFGVDDAGSCVYVPFYCGISRVPFAYAEGNGDMLTYSDKAAFWIFNRVAHFAYLFYDRVIPDIRKHQSLLESKFYNDLPATDEKAKIMFEYDQNAGRNYITEYTGIIAEYTASYWKELGNYLLVKYLDGNVKKEKDGKLIYNEYEFPPSPDFPGYPDSWKKNIIDNTGDKFLMPAKSE